jgi:hypothetical protein
MRFVYIAIGLWTLAAGLRATTIDVSSQPAQLLQSGDSLEFLFSDNSYAQHASATGIAGSPTQIFFNFISVPVDSAGQFTATVESVDGSASAMFPGPVEWIGGAVQRSGYDGAASVLMGSLMLSSELSQQIFAGSEAELRLTYQGPDITVGLPGYALKNDLIVSLAGGSFSVGAMNYGVTLSRDLGIVAPEPDPVTMLVTTGLLLCLVSGALKRFARRQG